MCCVCFVCLRFSSGSSNFFPDKNKRRTVRKQVGAWLSARSRLQSSSFKRLLEGLADMTLLQVHVPCRNVEFKSTGVLYCHEVLQLDGRNHRGRTGWADLINHHVHSPSGTSTSTVMVTFCCSKEFLLVVSRDTWYVWSVGSSFVTRYSSTGTR